eukprot:8858860-Heterocapsa_arctica.AAC.1
MFLIQWATSRDLQERSAARRALRSSGDPLPHLEIRTLGDRPGARSPFRAILVKGDPRFLHCQQDDHPQGR